MATTTIPRTAIKGGSFLIESCRPEEIFSPADLSDDQKLIGQTDDEFVTKEVLPLANELEQHKEGLMPELVRKAAELGLMGGGIPEEDVGSGLDKISATVLAEKLSAYASFSVTHGAHAGIGTRPFVYFAHDAQDEKQLPNPVSSSPVAAY